MADDYTPSTGEVRRRYAYARSDKPPHKNQRAVAEFDRWLAAHDAEKRAEWEAEQGIEQPEWEYGYTSKWGTIATPSQEDAEARAAEHTRGIRENRESGDFDRLRGPILRRTTDLPRRSVIAATIPR